MAGCLDAADKASSALKVVNDKEFTAGAAPKGFIDLAVASAAAWAAASPIAAFDSAAATEATDPSVALTFPTTPSIPALPVACASAVALGLNPGVCPLVAGARPAATASIIASAACGETPDTV